MTVTKSRKGVHVQVLASVLPPAAGPAVIHKTVPYLHARPVALPPSKIQATYDQNQNIHSQTILGRRRGGEREVLHQQIRHPGMIERGGGGIMFYFFGRHGSVHVHLLVEIQLQQHEKPGAPSTQPFGVRGNQSLTMIPTVGSHQQP